MAPKPCTPQSLSTTLCISLLLLLVLLLFFSLGWGTCTSINSSSTRNRNLVSVINRKTLPNKFDFTAFHGQHRPGKPDPADSEIDPRYGVEKRKVPTGPNPLHH